MPNTVQGSLNFFGWMEGCLRIRQGREGEIKEMSSRYRFFHPSYFILPILGYENYAR
jgi:hypothetical protein